MHQKGGQLEIEVSNSDLDEIMVENNPDLGAGKYVKLAVRDSGYGISKENLEKIFDPFFTTKPEGEGSGIGLATVHGIVKELGGTVIVYSEENKGTTFTVYFPASDQKRIELTDNDSSIPTGTEKIHVGSICTF